MSNFCLFYIKKIILIKTKLSFLKMNWLYFYFKLILRTQTKISKYKINHYFDLNKFKLKNQILIFFCTLIHTLSVKISKNHLILNK